MAEHLEADAGRYLEAAALNVAPPPIASDPLVAGGTPIEQLLRTLGLAANSGDPADSAEGADRHSERDIWANEAAGTFTEQDSAAAQQLPQLISGITGALTGALGAALQPIAQLPQQLAQGAQQAMEVTASLLGRGGVADPPTAEETMDVSELDSPQAYGDSRYPEMTPVPATAPAAALGPPPAVSPATYPSGPTGVAPTRVPTAPAASAPPAAMTGAAMVPPAMMQGTGGDSRNDSKADTKRIAVPTNRTEAKPAVAQQIRNVASVEPA